MPTETMEELVDRLDRQDVAEKARLEAVYPCLIETRIPSLPTTMDAMRDAVGAFLGSLGFTADLGGRPGDPVLSIWADNGRMTARIEFTDMDAMERDREPERRRTTAPEWMERRGQVGHGCD